MKKLLSCILILALIAFPVMGEDVGEQQFYQEQVEISPPVHGEITPIETIKPSEVPDLPVATSEATPETSPEISPAATETAPTNSQAPSPTPAATQPQDTMSLVESYLMFFGGNQENRQRFMELVAEHEAANETIDEELLQQLLEQVFEESAASLTPITPEQLPAAEQQEEQTVIRLSDEERVRLAQEYEQKAQWWLEEQLAAGWQPPAVVQQESALQTDVSKPNYVPNKPTGLNTVSRAPMVAAGDAHTLLLRADGTVWQWGEFYNVDYDALIGDYYVKPTKVTNLDSVIQIAANAAHSIALKSDGTVWQWGDSLTGSWSDGTLGECDTAVKVDGLENIVAISAGRTSCYALKSNGTVYRWGRGGEEGYLADESGTIITGVKAVEDGTLLFADGTAGQVSNVVAITGELALTSDGKVYQLDGTALFPDTLTDVISIVGEANTGFAIKSDGTVWGWGNNYYGQLGDGTTTARTTPIQIQDLENVVSIAKGLSSTAVLKQDGSVWMVGARDKFRFGDGIDGWDDRARQVYLPQGIISAEAGASHSMALGQDGKVWTWGDNTHGQLGNGTYISQRDPVEVTGLTEVTAIAAGDFHSLALKADGTVWAWGHNTFGQLGDGTNTRRTAPVQVKRTDGTPLSGIVAIAAGRYFSLALTEDGKILAWGANEYGQLGDGTTTSRFNPVNVKVMSGTTLQDLTGATSISSGRNHSVAVTENGTLLAWGWNNNGQLGDNTRTDRHYAIQAQGLSDVKYAAAGGAHSIAVKEDNSIWAWGYNSMGQIGVPCVGDSVDRLLVPTQMREGSAIDVVQMEAGWSYSGAVLEDGGELVWGWYGTSSDPYDIFNYHNPSSVRQAFSSDRDYLEAALDNVAAISLGLSHNLAVKKDGTVWAWGENDLGQLGSSEFANYYTDWKQVIITSSAAVQAATGTRHSAVLKSDGTVWTTGEGPFGQLGAGNDVVESSTPVQVVGLSHVKQIASGYMHTLALKEDGTVWAWGNNWNDQEEEVRSGQLGDGTTENRYVPVQVKGVGGEGYLNNIVAVAAGGWTSYALSADGHVYAWGSNRHGRLGNEITVGSDDNVPYPVRVKGKNGVGYLENVTAISAGWYHTTALLSDGTVVAWGNSIAGQLGNGTTVEQQYYPVAVVQDGNGTLLSNVRSISTNGMFNLAVLKDGTVKGWGSNNFHQMGLISGSTNVLIARQVPGLDNIVTAAAGGQHSMAIKSNGDVLTIGRNGYGQLGIGSYSNIYTPTVSEGFAGAVSFACDQDYTLAIKSDGTVWATGNTSFGVFGSTDVLTEYRINIPVPAYVTMPNDDHADSFTEATAYTLGKWTSGDINDAADVDWFTFTPRYDDLVELESEQSGEIDYQLYWNDPSEPAAEEPNTPLYANYDGRYPLVAGRQYYIKVSGNQVLPYEFRLVQAPDKTELANVQAAAGMRASYVLKQNGTVWAWGTNDSGQLGDGTTVSRREAKQISGLSDVASIEAGYNHAFAIKKDGTLWAWGTNHYAQIGDGTKIDRHTPVKITGISDIVQIAAGEKHNLALTSEGKVYAWGMNTSGQLGDGTTTGRYSPTEITGISGVKSIAVGGEGSWAVKEDGTVWHWGKGYSGTNYPTSSTPTQIAGLTNFAAVYAGGAGVLGIKENGDVWIFYAVGISQPTQLPGIDGIAEVSFGEQFAIARKDDGTVWAMGFNNMGQLGDGTTATRDTAPVQTKNLANVADISAGYWHSLTITADGKVWGWGSGKSGQLGEFDEDYSTVPIQIAGKINDIAEPLPTSAPPPIRKTGVEYEQNTPSYTDLTPPDIHTVHMEILNFSKGIYRLTITDADYTLDSRGTPFFFWSAEEGTFSEPSEDYKSVIFTADENTKGRKVRVVVGMGDGLGQVIQKAILLDGVDVQ